MPPRADFNPDRWNLADLALERHDSRIQARALDVAACVNRRADWMDFSPGARRDFLRAAYRSLASDDQRLGREENS